MHTPHPHYTRTLPPQKPSGTDAFGAFFDIALRPGLDPSNKSEGESLNVLVHRGEDQDSRIRVDNGTTQVWVVSGVNTVFNEALDPTGIPRGDLGKARAYWLSRDVLAVPFPSLSPTGAPRRFQLLSSDSASLSLGGGGAGGISGADRDPLTLEVDSSGLPQEVLGKFPHLAGYTCLRLPGPTGAYDVACSALGAVEMAPSADVASEDHDRWTESCCALLQSQLAIAAFEPSARGLPVVADATCVQIAGALDDFFAYEGPLGADIRADGSRSTLRVWAPTARTVRVLLWDGPYGGSPFEMDMKRGVQAPGVWSADIPSSWTDKYYNYEARIRSLLSPSKLLLPPDMHAQRITETASLIEHLCHSITEITTLFFCSVLFCFCSQVTVFSPTSGRVERSVATDPYSRSLNCNGTRTHLRDIGTTDLMPEGWASLAGRKPPLQAFTDAAIYELHVRDFSATDQSVPHELRGTFLAFTQNESHGARHLRALAAAGLTHLHLLPIYDFGSVDEDRSQWRWPNGDLRAMAPDSEEQQSAVVAVQDQDGYNWG